MAHIGPFASEAHAAMRGLPPLRTGLPRSDVDSQRDLTVRCARTQPVRRA